MNSDDVIMRLEQYRKDFDLHTNSYAKQSIADQLLGFVSALSYSDLPYPILKYWGDEWAVMSAEVTNLIYGESKTNEISNRPC